MYSKLLDKIIWVLEKIVMVLLGVAIVIIACQVFCRYVLESPLWWSEQTARCLFYNSYYVPDHFSECAFEY